MMTNRQFLIVSLSLYKNFFWNSEIKLKALFLFTIILALTIAGVVLATYFAAWNALFWSALTTVNAALFLQQMLIFTLLIGIELTFHALKKYIKENLILLWREWLTRKLIKDYTDERPQNYLKIVRECQDLDSPEQRIQEDVNTFANHAVHHLFDFIKSSLRFVTFIGALWIVGGSLSLSLWGLSVTIPGYLVWVALLFSVTASYITHKLGQFLTTLNQRVEMKEAKFRQSIHENHQYAENIALEKADHFYQKLHEHRLKKIIHLASQKIILVTKLEGFRQVYAVIADFFPYLVSAPIYFAGLISMGQLMQIGFYFSEINQALNWFINSYETLASFKASSQRIMDLTLTMRAEKPGDSSSKIERKRSLSTTDILLEHLDIQKPNDQNYVLQDLNLCFKRGEHTLIQGPSASGKSTLFKVLSGSWSYGQGHIKIPFNDELMCLPQFITIPDNLSLRQLVAYPHSSENIPEAEFAKLLDLIPILGKNRNQLDQKKIPWSQRLSGGEKQQLAFARALLAKPQWLLLDETTASLDADIERQMYQLLKENLPTTTIISISHKEHLADLHDRVLPLSSRT